MSRGFSFAQIGGVLGKDPESRSTPGGTKVVNFSLAVEKGFGDGLKTNWFNIVAFRDTAEFAEKYLKKGKSVTVTGDLQTRSWDDKQTGAKRTATEIIAYKIDFADSGSKSDSPRQERTASAPATRQTAAPRTRSTAPAEPDPFDDDPDAIPF